MENDNESDLGRALRLHKARVRKVTFIDGDTRRDVNVKVSRLVVAQTIALAKKLPWQAAELFDEKGGILDIVRNRGEAGEVEDLTRTPDIERQANFVLRIVDRCMSARSAETKEAMNAMVLTMRELQGAVGALAAIHRQSVDAAVELANLRPQAALPESTEAAEESPSAKAMAAIAPMLLQRLLVAVLQGGGAGGGPPPPPPANGQPGQG